MLEYFSIKKVKKLREDKAEKQRLEKEKEKEEQAKGGKATTSPAAAASPPPSPAVATTNSTEDPVSPKIVSKPDNTTPGGTPLLDPEDEKFLERLASPADNTNDDDDETPPPLPPRVKTPVIEIDSDSSDAEDDKPGKGKGKAKDVQSGSKSDAKEKSQNKRFSFVTNLSRNMSLRRNKPSSSNKAGLSPTHLDVPDSDADKEETDMARVLDDLNISASGNKAFSLSRESAEMVQRFTQVLKDLVNGAPTAYGDLVNLIEDRDGILARNYEKLPKSLKKLVTQLPEKLTMSLAPELLAVAAESQGLNAAGASGSGGGKAGLKGAAQSFLTPKNLKELVTKPGAVAGMLKAIVNALKTRWPAFIGTNVLWSVAVFLLLSVLWYCYKRGREVRLEQEAAATRGDPIDGSDRIEELPDDPQLMAPPPAGAEDSLDAVLNPKDAGSATPEKTPVMTGASRKEEKVPA